MYRYEFKLGIRTEYTSKLAEIVKRRTVDTKYKIPREILPTVPRAHSNLERVCEESNNQILGFTYKLRRTDLGTKVLRYKYKVP